MKLDKKQLPQYLVLGVLTAGLGGYTVYHFAAAGPASADTRPAAARIVTGTAAPAQAVKPGLAGAGPAVSAAAIADTSDAPPPTPAMHDPFAVGYVDPGTLPAPVSAAALKLPPSPGKQVASLGAVSPLPVGLPAAPPLPGSGIGRFSLKSAALPAGLPVSALPAAPALPEPPKWTVTGVLMGAGGEVAILRNGDARRIVRAGDFVDGVYRVTGVSRTAVQLRHGAAVYRIVLGEDKPAPKASVSPVPAFVPVPVPAAAPQPTLEMPAALGSAIVPVHSSAQPKPVPAQVARAISLGLRLLDGSVLAPRKE